MDNHRFVGKVFENARLEVDGSTYERCKFLRCRIGFSAIDTVVFKECVFTQCEWIFEGPAETTLAYLSALYRGLGAGGQQLVDGIFQGIRDGTVVSQTSEYYDERKAAVAR